MGQYNERVKPVTDWQGNVTGYKAERIFPNIASASRGQTLLDEIDPAGFSAAAERFMDPPEEPAYPGTPRRPDGSIERLPPNCDGFQHAGEALAHAQHEAAVDGDECTSAGCLITRGSD
jgi:hypothetical protein